MAEQLYPNALTSLQRVKDLLGITNADFDAILTREINSVTDYIERECNRHFLMQKYSSEIHSQWGARQNFVILRWAPVFYMTDVVNLTAGSQTITLNNINGVQVGMPIIGDEIASGSYIIGIAGSVITLNLPTTGTNAAADVIINGLLKMEYRAGTPDNPNWTKFYPPQFEAVDDARAGIVRVYGYLATIYNNAIKATYWGGWLIDWNNAGDKLTHTLPADITRSCENIVIRWFKRRTAAGKKSETLTQATIAYNDLLDSQDLDVINHYRRVPGIM